MEKHLLQVLNEAKGRILDDDTVISSLETLKEEAAEVSKKVEETDEVMKGDIICKKKSRISLSNFSCMFLNPNIFFQFEFCLF